MLEDERKTASDALRQTCERLAWKTTPFGPAFSAADIEDLHSEWDLAELTPS